MFRDIYSSLSAAITLICDRDSFVTQRPGEFLHLPSSRPPRKYLPTAHDPGTGNGVSLRHASRTPPYRARIAREWNARKEKNGTPGRRRMERQEGEEWDARKEKDCGGHEKPDPARVTRTVRAACRDGARKWGAGRADARLPRQHPPLRPATSLPHRPPTGGAFRLPRLGPLGQAPGLSVHDREPGRRPGRRSRRAR